MDLSTLLQPITEHLKTYFVAGTLAAVGRDVASNVEHSVGGSMATMPMVMMPVMEAMPEMAASGLWAVALRGVGVGLLVMGLSLYALNLWCGYRALRAFRFRFRERGLILKACGWSAAFAYVIGSIAIGLSVEAVYLALVS